MKARMERCTAYLVTIAGTSTTTTQEIKPMSPKLVYSLNAQESKDLDRMIDVDIEDGMHPDLLEDLDEDEE